MKQVFFSGAHKQAISSAHGAAGSPFEMAGFVDSSAFPDLFAEWYNPDGTSDAGNTVVCPDTGTLSSLRVDLDTDPNPGQYTFEIFKGSGGGGTAGTNLQVVLPSGTTSAQDNTHVVNVTAGDYLYLNVATTNGTPTVSKVRWSLLWTGSTSNQAIMATNNPFSTSTNAVPFSTTVNYNCISSAKGDWSTTESSRYFYCPTSGTIKSFYVYFQVAPSGTGKLTFSIYKNGVEDATTKVDVTQAGGANQVVSATGLSISFTTGDTLTISVVKSGTLTNGGSGTGVVSWGIMYSPTTDGESMFGGLSGGNLTNVQNTNEYVQLVASRKLTTTESDFKSLAVQAFTIKNLRVNLSAAPGASQTRQFGVRKNGANGNSLISISGASTTGTDNTNTDSISAGDLVNLYHVPTTASVATSTAFWSGVQFIASTQTQTGGAFLINFMHL